ncbi:leucine-rich repeat, immunoglobulin-like domain and transmembrane domain-containing protein 3 isoform X1 [Acipenser ruthenus]|uniref:leucine-rich repeat, immunoglobulin-like domain and transmembrane domain-containing protein 3 isoform X1 n=1 Tax=Acipenser ruthenus TaxID=7906 RepID=UPI0027429B70|nr:leucine-rich repeat, immunoglobulin-like domain and transmembrane domain-containing protein 3 isoform X1 [Acipenser ruthenus]
MSLLIYIYILLCCFTFVHPFCPSQCTCIYHGRSDGTGTRSVLCNDPDMSDIPVNVPVDTVKLRVEKTVVRKIPTEAFYYLVDLKYLWVTYNSISTIASSSFYNLKVLHELRLDGNLLSSFPWESLQEMPNLRSLDLHNNRLSTVPADAGRYLQNIKYLDISSNKLTTLPSDLIDIWPPFSASANIGTDSLPERVILGLQDNPWFCDCRISKLIELSKTFEMAVVLLDPLLTCSGPENLAGVLFQRAELEQCLKPSVMTSATKMTSPLGSNVLLRCDATGYPTPILIWTKSDGSPVNNTECCRQVASSFFKEKLPRTLKTNLVQESPGEGIRWSIISLNGILYQDAGEYRCKAKNLAGMSEASITLTVVGVITTTASPLRFSKRLSAEQSVTTLLKTEPITEGLTTLSPTTLATTTLSRVLKKNPVQTSQTKPAAGGTRPTKSQPAVNNQKPQEEDGNTTTSAVVQKITIKNLQVVGQTEQSAVVTWLAPNAPRGVALNVMYSEYGVRDKQMINTDTGKSKISIDGLVPSTKYTACVSLKGSQPKKDQCIVFSTLDAEMEDPQAHILIVAGGIACAIALPLVIVLLYKVLKLYCKKSASEGDDLSKETYVKFETLSLKQKTTDSNGDLWARRNTSESERMLLYSRSSIDSQMTFKSDNYQSEYLY